jgi:PhnB protein
MSRKYTHRCQAPAHFLTLGRKQMSKPVSAIPEGFRSVTPYLVVPGVPKLLDFLTHAFGAQELVRADGPEGSVVHAGVKIGDSMLEMGEVGGTERQPLTAGLHYYVRDVDAAYQKALAAGATSLYEPTVMDYGDREAGIEDMCGNHWYIGTQQSGPSYRPELLQDLNPSASLKDAPRFITFLEMAFAAALLEKHVDQAGKIGHAKLRIGDTVMELREGHGKWGPRPTAFHYYTKDCDEVFARGLGAGGKQLLAVKDQPYGERGGSLLDDWGNHWYIATHQEDVTLEEIQLRSASASSES